MCMNDVMIDIETMGTKTTAPIVSIAAVMFDIRTESFGEQFVKHIHLATAMRHGAIPEASTIMWWMRQGDEVRRPIWNGGEDIREVLRDLAIWMHLQGGDALRPWGNSARFDLGILEAAFQRASMPVPWRWSNERCFRTVRNLNPQVPYDPEEKGDGAHDPLVDCKFQIEHLFKIKRSRHV